MIKYEILQDTICDGWVNTWKICNDDGSEVPEQFDTYEEAKEALIEFLEESDQAYFNGDIESRYRSDEFKIVKVKK